MHATYIQPEFTDDIGHMGKPFLHVRIHPYPAKIFVSRSIAEPSAHLEQGVISLGVPVKITDAKSLQCQPT